MDRRWTGFKAGFWTGYYIELEIHRVDLAMSLRVIVLSAQKDNIRLQLYNMCGFFQPEERGGAGPEMKMRRTVQEEDLLDRALCLTF